MKINLQLFGGRGASSSVKRTLPNVGNPSFIPKNHIDEDEYLEAKGLGSPTSFWSIDKLRSNKQITSQNGRKKFNSDFENAQNEYKNARNKAKEEYKKLVDSGKIKPKTRIEKILKNAHGHEDLQSTQASRRLAKKRGYDWKTGKRL